VRALLALFRESKEHMQLVRAPCLELLQEAARHLKILDPVRGKKELIKSVAGLAKSLE